MIISIKSQSAFTLLEVLVSLSIVVVVLVGVLRLHGQSIMMIRESSFLVTAPLLANAKLAEFESILPIMPETDGGDFGGRYPDWRWHTAVEDVLIEDLGRVSGDVKRIDLTVCSNRGERCFQLRAYRFVR